MKKLEQNKTEILLLYKRLKILLVLNLNFKFHERAQFLLEADQTYFGGLRCEFGTTFECFKQDSRNLFVFFTL